MPNPGPSCIDCHAPADGTELFRDEDGRFQKRCDQCGYESSWGGGPSGDDAGGQASLGRWSS